MSTTCRNLLNTLNLLSIIDVLEIKVKNPTTEEFSFDYSKLLQLKTII
nr:hypothetical protein [Flavobacterium sp. ASV13]